MQLLDSYIRLCVGCLKTKTSLGQPIEISLADVAAVLFCTHRNAALTMKKMQSQGWLNWQPGKGRGNKSVLTCLAAPQALVLSIAKELVQKGEIRASRELVARHQEDLPGLAEEYARWMSSQFGPHVTRENGILGRIDTLRLFVDRPFQVLDPIHVLLRSESHLVKHLFDCLVRFHPQTNEIQPQLAYYWETDESGKVWTFYLRKGVLFHHGRSMTADDVCFSLLRLQAQVSRHRWLAASIQAVEAVDDHVVQIILNQPDELFLHALSKEYLAIVPRDYVEQMGAHFSQMPVGTGPFRVVRNDDSMLALEAFLPYFGGRPFLDRIEIWCVPGLPDDTEEERKRLLLPVMGQEGDGAMSVSAMRGVSRNEHCFQYVSLNGAKEGPLRNKSFRQAVASLIHAGMLRSDLGGARERVAVWGEAMTSGDSEQDSLACEVSRAAEESGYEGVPLRLYTYPDPDHVEDAEWIQKRCARFGIRVDIVYALPKELAEPALMQSADLIVDSANIDEREDLSLLEFLYAEVGSVRYHLEPGIHAKINELARSMMAGKTWEERKQYVTPIVKTLREQSVFVPLYSNRVEMLAHPRVSGLSLDAYGWVDFTRIFLRYN